MDEAHRPIVRAGLGVDRRDGIGDRPRVRKRRAAQEDLRGAAWSHPVRHGHATRRRSSTPGSFSRRSPRTSSPATCSKAIPLDADTVYSLVLLMPGRLLEVDEASAPSAEGMAARPLSASARVRVRRVAHTAWKSLGTDPNGQGWNPWPCIRVARGAGRAWQLNGVRRGVPAHAAWRQRWRNIDTKTSRRQPGSQPNDAAEEARLTERQKDFTRRALLRAGWLAPVVTSMSIPSAAAQAQSPGPHNDAHGDLPHQDEIEIHSDIHLDEPAVEHEDVPEGHEDHTDGTTHGDSHGTRTKTTTITRTRTAISQFTDHTDGGHTDHLDTNYHTDHTDTSGYKDHLDKGHRDHNDGAFGHKDLQAVR